MTDQIETLLTRNLLEVFGQRDALARQATIAELFTEDCTFFDHDARHTGREELDRAVAALLTKFPDFTFTERGRAQTLRDAARGAWGFGPPGKAPVVTGMDVIVVRDDRIAALYAFVDPPAA